MKCEILLDSEGHKVKSLRIRKKGRVSLASGWDLRPSSGVRVRSGCAELPLRWCQAVWSRGEQYLMISKMAALLCAPSGILKIWLKKVVPLRFAPPRSDGRMNDGPIAAGDRRVVPDAMAWRHHDSDVYDAFPDNDLSIHDVKTLTERVIDLRVVPPGLVFSARLATTWDFPGFFPVFKDTGGNGNMWRLRTPKLSPLARRKKLKRRANDGGGSSKLKRRKVPAKPKGATASSGHVSSPTPLWTIAPINQIALDDTGHDDGEPNALGNEDRSASHSPHGSVSESVHNFTNVEDIGAQEIPPRMEPFVNMSEPHVHPKKVPVFLSETNADGSSHPLNCEAENLSTGAPASRLRQILTGWDIKEGDSSCGSSVYVPQWVIPLRCRVDTPEWCRELMVHLAPPTAQEESNALTNEVALQRAWFSLARGAMAQTDILERFKNLLPDYDTLADTHAECLETVRKLVTAREDLEHNAKLYTNAINRYRAVKEEHAGCGQKVQILENEKNYLSTANHDQAAQIQSLEAELAKKDFALTYAERMLAEGAKDREKLTAQLGQPEIDKFDYIRKLLPTVASRLLKSHEYKESLSEPFNMAIQAGWGKGLSEGCTNKEIMAVLQEFENFDPYSDKKLYPMYDKLFEKEYPYIEKIASGYRHSVADLLKVHPDPAPSEGTSTPTISKSLD
ncbi:hypothetical protein Tco_0820481 [Tanacetum coccineum]|uniref:Uncharacterized protein n=1 Tax=Tanacetum coccineum TaxID=301880 RepID=A0ABQ5AC56_9ASTR